MSLIAAARARSWTARLNHFWGIFFNMRIPNITPTIMKGHIRRSVFRDRSVIRPSQTKRGIFSQFKIRKYQAPVPMKLCLSSLIASRYITIIGPAAFASWVVRPAKKPRVTAKLQWVGTWRVFRVREVRRKFSTSIERTMKPMRGFSWLLSIWRIRSEPAAMPTRAGGSSLIISGHLACLL